MSGKIGARRRIVGPYQALASAVLQQAVDDLRARDPDVRDDARRFAAGDHPGLLRFWCDAAGLPFEATAARLAARAHGRPSPH